MTNAAATLIVILFPFLLPVWQERPIVNDDVRPGPYPSVVPTAVLELQKEGFQLGDTEYRARLAVAVRQANNAQASDVLLWQLAKERDGQVIATLLDQAAQLPGAKDKMETTARRYWNHALPEIRLGAVRLYGAAGGPAAEAVRKLAAEDKNPGVRWQAWNVLVPQTGDSDNQAFFTAHWQDADAGVRALALGAFATTSAATSHRNTFVSACKDPAVEVRYKLATVLDKMPRPLAVELSRKLAEDTHASVREATADGISRLETPELLPVLLKLADDKDVETRRFAVHSLREFPQPAAVAKAIAHFPDVSAQVRQEAEDSVVILNAKEPVIADLAENLNHREHFMRYHVCRSLGRLKAKDQAKAVLARLDQEDRPDNIAAAIFALGLTESKFAAEAVAKRATHDDAGVRKEVAAALGYFFEPKTNDTLRDLVFDKAAPVREAALLSIGRLKDGWFNPTLLKVLETVAGPEPVSGADRRYACWLAANVKPYSMEVLKRVVVQATSPVIPTPMGPIFEDDLVLISCEFALVQVARNDPAVKPLADKVLDYHTLAANAKPGANMGPGSLYPSEELKEYLRQAKAWYTNEKIEKKPRPTWEITMPYRRVREPEAN